MRANRWMLPAAAAVLLTAMPASRAQEPETVVGEVVEVSEVLLDVVVTDNRGNVVLGLDKDDFVVTENGSPVELNSATFYSHLRFLDSLDNAAELGIDPASVSVDRQFILFFHDQRRELSRLTARQLDAGRRARQWVASELEPTDWVAVVAYDTSLKILQDFTNDRQQLDGAIGRAVQGLDPVTEDAVRQPQGAPSLLPAFSALDMPIRRVYDALEAVARSTAHIRGRKNLAMFSIGFGEVNRFGFYTPDRRYYPEMVQALNDANVAVYAIDLIPSSDSLLGSSLNSLAADTGGEYYSTFVNFLAPLEQMATDNNGYYLLGYSVDKGAQSGYQEVAVDVRNPLFKVRARTGYLYGE